MITKGTVRRSPVTGLGRTRRVKKGCIYLSKEWVGSRVFVVSMQDFYQLNRELRAARLSLKRIERAL